MRIRLHEAYALHRTRPLSGLPVRIDLRAGVRHQDAREKENHDSGGRTVIRLIEALNFRCLRYIRQELSDFHVLVGPNGAGKTSFLDVPVFLGELCRRDVRTDWWTGLMAASRSMWPNWHGTIELAVELEVPQEKRQLLANQNFDLVRYEVSVGTGFTMSTNGILAEKVLLKESSKQRPAPQQTALFPRPPHPPESIITPKAAPKTRTVVNKIPGGNDNFYAETGKGWNSFKLGPERSALNNLPADETKFPVTTWLREVLVRGVRKIDLDVHKMMGASPAFPAGELLETGGTNLPWVVHSLKEKDQQAFDSWIEHVKTAIPDLETVQTVSVPESGSRFLLVCYENELKVPQFSVSAGTLRLLALTVLAYLPDITGVWLIEEPENGIHPQGIETVFQSLSSVYGGQVLLATHSPLIVSLADADQVLCFAKTVGGATDVIRGSDHPALRNWKGEENLGVLYAGGVLG
jgi:ABC-type transport system involved in cytochrome c biogenesis ATPase subunit